MSAFFPWRGACLRWGILVEPLVHYGNTMRRLHAARMSLVALMGKANNLFHKEVLQQLNRLPLSPLFVCY